MPHNFRRDRLIEALNKQKGQSKLLLVDMYITDEGCPLVANFLQNYPNYNEVDLKSNKLTPNGLLKLCKAFRVMKNLQILSLSNNYIGQDARGIEGLYSLMVQINSNIKELNLRNNEIADECGKLLADMIKDSQSLKSLDLRWNKLTTVSGEIILASLDSKEFPISIQVTGNQIQQPILSGLMEYLKPQLDQMVRLRVPTLAPAQRQLSNELVVRPPPKIPVIYPGERMPQEIKQTEHFLDQMEMINFENKHEMESLKRRFEVIRNQNQDLVAENKALKSEYDQIQVMNQRRMTDLVQIKDEQRDIISDKEAMFKQKMSSMLNDYDKKIFKINAEWDKRLSNVADKRNILKDEEMKLQEEVQKLKDDIFLAKRQHDDHLRDLEMKTREDEYSKYHACLCVIEGKIRALEEQRVIAQKRYMDTVEDIQSQMKVASAEYVKVKEVIEKGNYDALFLQRNLSNFRKLQERQIAIEKNKEVMKHKALEEVEKLKKEMIQDKKLHNRNLHLAEEAQIKEKKDWDMLKVNYTDEIQDLEREVRAQETDFAKLRGAYTKLTSLLQTNTSKIIIETFLGDRYV